MKRRNESTAQFYRRGDFNPDTGMYFWKYDSSKTDSEGYFRLHWLHEKSFKRAVAEVDRRRKESQTKKREGLLVGRKRLNPRTNKPFVLGDEVADGKFFVSYDLRLVLKDGFFYERTCDEMTMFRKRVQMRVRTLERSAKNQKIPFDLDVDYLASIFPPDKKCPVLGIPLVWGGLDKSGKGGPAMNSPSVDKLYPDKGYVKGNVSWMSMRANYIKQDAASHELEAVARWLALKGL